MRVNWRQDMISDILNLVSIKSFTGDSLGIRRCQNALTKIAAKMGYASTLKGKGKVLIIEPKSRVGSTEPAKLGLVVHIDTVPFERFEWKHNPLGEISKGRIYGRGVLDDKGAAIIALYAMHFLEGKIDDSWQIIVGSSEEKEWVDMEEFLKENPILPDFLVTVDGDSVQNGCRGYLDLTLSFERATKTSKISNFYVPMGVNNAVPSEAVAIINGKKVYYQGVAVHSSIPEEGTNALTHLSCRIQENNKDVCEEFPGFFELMRILKTNFEGEYIGFEKHDKIFNGQPIDGTSVSPTNCTMEGDTLKVNLNLRLGVTTTLEDIQKVKEHLSKTYGCTCEEKELTLPSYVPYDVPEIKYMCEAYEAVMGSKPEVTIAKGIGYNAALPRCAIFGPRFSEEHDEGDTCHRADENRKIDDIYKFFEMMIFFLRKTLKKEN